MKMIKLHYVKDNKEITINASYIISYERFQQNILPSYTEITVMGDDCYDVKETPQEIDNLIYSKNYSTDSVTSPNSKKKTKGGEYKWTTKPKIYRGRKKEIGL